MPPDQRIQELCAQLLRAENPAVIGTVGAELRLAISDYVRAKTSGGLPAVVFSPADAES